VKGLDDSTEAERWLPDPPAPPSEWIWVTRDGRQIKIVDLESAHLVNVIRFVERRYAALPEPTRAAAAMRAVAEMSASMATLSGEGARACTEGEIADYLGSPSDVWPIYNELVLEAEVRGVEVTGPFSPTRQTPGKIGHDRSHPRRTRRLR